jgi:tRNA threonylcarbamoyladenosine modification (KEOPS) complex  Pcc1 subunit
MWESSVYRSIFAEGRDRTSRRVAIALLKDGIAIDIIVRATGLSPKAIESLRAEELV